MQARGVSASLCYPSTSAICTWARTWLAAPGPPWKWGGGSVASAGPAPRHELDEPVIAMLPPCVVCVLGLPQLVVLVAARRPPRPTHLAISPERMPLTHGCHRPPPDMPAPGIEPTTLRLRDLRLAWLSEPGILMCMCVCVCVCSSLLAPKTWSRASSHAALRYRGVWGCGVWGCGAWGCGI